MPTAVFDRRSSVLSQANGPTAGESADRITCSDNKALVSRQCFPLPRESFTLSVDAV